MRSLPGAFVLLIAWNAFGQSDRETNLPVYVAHHQVHGTIRIWGHGAAGADYIESLVKRWEVGFAKLQPEVRFDNELHGTASAMGALYTDVGDLAVMGRQIWPAEAEAFRDVKGYAPTGVDVVTGSVDVRNKDFALTFVVNRVNPLERLSLEQIRDVFSVTGHPVRTWGDLGLQGEWAAQRVHLYGFEISRGFGYYLQQKAFDGASIWNPELVELGDLPRKEGGLYDAGQRVVDAVAKDPEGIGFSSALYRSTDVKVLALGRAGGPYVLPTKQTVAAHAYPLVQVITAFYDAHGERTVAVREFLRYIVSEQGQEAVREDGGYTALTPELSRTTLRELR